MGAKRHNSKRQQSRRKTAASSMGAHRNSPSRTSPNPPAKAAKKWMFQLIVALTLIGTISGYLVFQYPLQYQTQGTADSARPDEQSHIKLIPFSPVLHETDQLKPTSLAQLLTFDDEQLAQVDTARMNLLAAAGLPKAENLDVVAALAQLDRWAKQVNFDTQRHLYRVTDPRYAADYKNSEAVLRATFLTQVLYEDCGIHYDPAAIGSFSFEDSRHGFIHGMLPDAGSQKTIGGTCTSMPVLIVAVGRRLGYPLKLVFTQSHVFIRWEGEDDESLPLAWRETFNFETTNGFNVYSDEHYKSFPRQVTEEEIARLGLLQSLSPREELAFYLATRGHCQFDNKQYEQALASYQQAHRLDPARPNHLAWVRGTEQKLFAKHAALESLYFTHSQRTQANRPYIWPRVVIDRQGYARVIPPQVLQPPQMIVQPVFPGDQP